MVGPRVIRQRCPGPQHKITAKCQKSLLNEGRSARCCACCRVVGQCSYDSSFRTDKYWGNVIMSIGIASFDVRIERCSRGNGVEGNGLNVLTGRNELLSLIHI